MSFIVFLCGLVLDSFGDTVRSDLEKGERRDVSVGASLCIWWHRNQRAL